MTQPKTASEYKLVPIDWDRATFEFREFFHNFFVSPIGLIRKEVDLSFLRRLNAEERAVARSLLRQNLHLGCHIHLIEGFEYLGEESDVETLRTILEHEPELSRKITLARALWCISRDPVFYELLIEMTESKESTLKEAHLYDVHLLGDERAINLLIKILDGEDDFALSLALLELNELEFRKRFHIRYVPHQADYYRARRDDLDFLRKLSESLSIPRDEWPEKER